jgi:hypothetical protein
MNRTLRAGVCLLAGIAVFSLSMAAQETTAAVEGVVKDSSSLGVPNAEVELSSSVLIGGTQKTQTSSGGAYRITQLPPGIYSITVTAKGFTTIKQQNIRLDVGRVPTIDFSMQVGAVTQTIEVTSQTPLVDVTQSKVAVDVERDVIDNIPKGRSFQSLISFAPGARMEPLQGGRNDKGNSFQVDGASDAENVYLVDGVNMTDAQNGGVGKSFQIDFLETVQIKSTGFEAKYGGALGGVVNAIPKRGTNDWHGALLTYFQSNMMNANDPCLSGMTSGYNGANFSGPTAANVNTFSQGQVCGLRLNPSLAGLNNSTRLDGTPEYYIPKKDGRNIIEPGYEVSGPLMANRVWLFSSYIPTLDTIHRTVNFTGANPGVRTLTSSFVQHNMYDRLDYQTTKTLRLFASWNYSYGRQTGQLVLPDSAAGQINTGASTDPNTLRSDAGFTYPTAVYSFGADWTPTPKLVISARYGYFFSNVEQRGIPSGVRDVYQASVNANTRDLAGNPFPSSSFNTSGFANISSNLGRLYDAFKRRSFNVDGSYFAHGLGIHTIEAGYFQQAQANNVLNGYQGAIVDLFWGQSYQPLTSATACDAIKAQNVTNFGAAANQCQGQFGYFMVGGQAVTNTGGTTQHAHEFYIQDSWQAGHGLTLNLGVRFAQEVLPAYDPKRFPSLEFGWGQKIAPRIGVAYDVLHNGKLKAFASYGQFYDMMKMNLARGSFGSDYWHQCVYALDTTNYASISPTDFTGDGGCPASGPAPGVNARFIENLDLRATKADPRDPGIDVNMKPMKQHEITAGADWAVSTNWGLEARYSRKVLDNAIEDMSLTDSLGYYIGNPGSAYADILHRPVSIPCVKTAGFSCTADPVSGLYYNTTPFCTECPAAQPAIRNYDGLEFRFLKRPGFGKWFTQVSYTYSKLRGNYSGLVNTDPTDASGGRHSPNTSRAFDIPTMTYLPSGKPDNGPLASDRPNTANIFASYPLRWWHHMMTNFGVSETLYQGTPISTCLPSLGTSSACQLAEGRGNVALLARNPDGTIMLKGVDHDARTDPLIQTDLSIRHEISVSKSHEGMKLMIEAQASNLFNQHAKLAFYQFAIPSNTLAPSRAPRFAGDPGYDYGKLMNGFNYVDALNGTGSFAGVQSPLTLASRYGMPQLFQGARTMRLQIRFTF